MMTAGLLFAGWLLTADPYTDPRFQEVLEAATFHVSFDGDSFQPDMAEGPTWAPRFVAVPRPEAKPRLADGLAGRALVLGTGLALYPREGQVPLESRGALAFWIKPLEWRRPNGDNVGFASAGPCFIVQRQGPMTGADNKVLRQEGVQFLVKATADQKLYTCLMDYTAWPNGRWRLIVVNWAWPRIEMSIDAGPFVAESLPGIPRAELFGPLAIGSSGGDKALLDEVFAFRRPLTREEAQLLYNALQPK